MHFETFYANFNCDIMIALNVCVIKALFCKVNVNFLFKLTLALMTELQEF